MENFPETDLKKTGPSSIVYRPKQTKGSSTVSDKTELKKEFSQRRI